MYCPNCGRDNGPQARFCAACGAKIRPGTGGAPSPGAGPAPGRAPSPGSGPVPGRAPSQGAGPAHGEPYAYGSIPEPGKISGGDKWLGKLPGPLRQLPGKFIAIGAGAVALIVIIAITAIVLSGGTTRIDLNKYVEVEFDGRDESGTAGVSVDKKAIRNDYGNKKLKINKKKAREYVYEEFENEYGIEYESAKKLGLYFADDADEMMEELSESLEDYSMYDLVYAICEHASVTPRRNLSNGDIVTLEWGFESKSILKQIMLVEDIFGLELEYSDEDIRVSGLK